MVIIGLLLLIASLVFGADLVVQNGGVDLNPTVFGIGLGNITSGGQFALGAITGFAIALGIALILAGTKRRSQRTHRRRGELAESRRAIEAHKAENARLSEELTRERAQRAEPAGADGQGGAGGADVGPYPATGGVTGR